MANQSFSLASSKPVTYLKEVKTELEKVDWPTREQTIRLTAIVIAVSVFAALFLGFADFLFTKLMETII